jgi:hypothetical protein
MDSQTAALFTAGMTDDDEIVELPSRKRKKGLTAEESFNERYKAKSRPAEDVLCTFYLSFHPPCALRTQGHLACWVYPTGAGVCLGFLPAILTSIHACRLTFPV